MHQAVQDRSRDHRVAEQLSLGRPEFEVPSPPGTVALRYLAAEIDDLGVRGHFKEDAAPYPRLRSRSATLTPTPESPVAGFAVTTFILTSPELASPILEAEPPPATSGPEAYGDAVGKSPEN